MKTDQKYLALDLEFNQPSRKIIQVGVTIGNYKQGQENWIKTKWYVDPGESISEEIVSLTGITDQDIKDFAVPLDQVALKLGNLIQNTNSFVNPIVWGYGDSQALLDLFREQNIHFPYFGHRHIDVKTFYTFLLLAKGKNPAGGLRSALGEFKLQFEGKQHQADDDAFNTLRLFFALVKRQENLENVIKAAKEIIK